MRESAIINKLNNKQGAALRNLKRDLKITSAVVMIFASATFAYAETAEVTDNKTLNATVSDTTDNSTPKDVDSLKAAAEAVAPDLLNKATIEADSLSYDKDTQTLTAEKNVVLGYQDRQISADKIEYNQATKIINAENGVKYKDATNTVFKANNVIVTDSLDKGEMKDVEVDFGDGSKFNADNLTIMGPEKYMLVNGVYSPCDSCYDGHKIWQIDAKKINYNGDDGRVYYRDAYMEFFGQKIMWLPYLSHPTPFAQSKSGFLTPKFGKSSELGFYVQVPYYYQPASNIDFTITPYLTAEDGLIMILEHRHLYENGSYQIEVSGADPKRRDDLGNKIQGADNQFRGHIKTKGDFREGSTDDWGWGWNINRTTDDTYLRRYHIGSYDDILTSEVYTNYLGDRSYFSAKGVAFQGLRQNDDPAISPYVFPLIDAGKTFALSDNYNQKLETEFNGMNLRRDAGPDSMRAIGKGSYSADYISPGGQIVNLNLSTRFDHYNVENVPYLGGQYNGAFNRTIPEGSLTWSLPLQKSGQTYGLVLEPISMLILSPMGVNSAKIPNEDSQNIEIYDYNLFQEDHISGYDLLEEGPRVNYGVRGVVTTDDVGDYNFLLGQDYRFNKDPMVLGPDSGMDDNLSDYVGRVVTGSKKFQSTYRFRVDKDNYQFKRNEVGFNLNLDDISLASGYTFIDGTSPNPDRQEIYGGTTVKITDKWNVSMNARRNLDNDADNGWVNVGGGLGYVTSCISTSLELNREFTRDRDIKPSTDVIFKVNLANLGS